MSGQEINGFAAVLESGGGQPAIDCLAPGSRSLWEDDPTVQIWGEFPLNGLRTAAHPLGRAALFGQCMAGDEDLHKALITALDNDDPRRLAGLPGNFSVLVRQPGKTTAIAGPLGQPAVYWSRVSGQTIAASHPSLAAGNIGLQPDTRQIAAHLAVIGGGGFLMGRESSYYGVQKLAGGDIVTGTASGVQCSEYGQLGLESFVADNSGSLDNAASRLRHALIASVVNRLESGRPVSSDLSGGLDSSSLAFIAHGQLDTERLPVFFSGRPNLNTGDEAYARFLYNLGHKFNFNYFDSRVTDGPFNQREFSDIEYPQDLAVGINITPQGWRFMTLYLNFIAQTGSRLHITGDGGDEVTGVESNYLANLARLPSAGRFISDCLAFARLQNRSPASVWRQMIHLARFDPSVNCAALAESFDENGQGSSRPGDQAAIWKAANAGTKWLTAQSRKEVAAYLRAASPDIATPDGFRPGDYFALDSLWRAAQSGALIKHCAAASGTGLSVHSPYFDNAVIEAALSVPAEVRGDPKKAKAILAAALDGVVPAEVFARRSKSHYDQVVVSPYADSLPTLREIFKAPCLADLGVIEPGPIRAIIEHLDTVPLRTIWCLGRVVAAEGWLRQLDERGLLSTATAKTTGPILVAASAPAQAAAMAANTKDGSTAIMKETSAATEYLTLPVYVHAVASNKGELVFLNRQTNRYHPMDRTTSTITRALAGTSSLRQAVDLLNQRYAGVSRQQLWADTARCRQELLALGLIQIAPEPATSRLPAGVDGYRLEANEQAMARPDTTPAARLSRRVLATGAMAVGRVLERYSPHHKLSLLQKLQRRWANRDATYSEAHELLVAAHRVPSLGRIACNEASYAASLAGAVARQRIGWHLGVSFGPLVFHAWNEAEGRPVRTPLEGQVVGRFQSFFD